MASWRFDQGRLDYLQFDEICRIASALSEIDGIKKPKFDNDFLREALEKYSKRPFSPENYTVWRNYKRVFGCLLLATEINGKIVCTELCKILSKKNQSIDCDDYLKHFTTNFYYPSPIFSGYNINEKQIYPVAAIIKLLISRYLITKNSSISIVDIGNYLISNNVSGLEDLDFYSKLSPKKFFGDLRQPRELVAFISQFSFLKWNNPNLFIEVSSNEESLKIFNYIEPNIKNRVNNPGAELIQLGSCFDDTRLGDLTISRTNVIDVDFTEGNRVKVTHLRTERSDKLKDFYFENTESPHICDMCTMDTLKRYPWADRIIELHHLLPLSSPVRVESGKTSIKDIAGICPSCHRATHKFYSKWLKQNGRNDFNTYEEARQIYNKAKQEIILI